jgi:glycerol kinase
MSYLLAVDQGTSSSRAIIFSLSGQVICTAQKPFDQSYPKAGWVEHCPNQIWQSQSEVIDEVIQKSSIKTSDIKAIGITNQRETTVVWDRTTGNPIYPAIVWQDRRTSEFCAQLKSSGQEQAIKSKTGLVLDPYFSASKLKWILDNVTDARSKADSGQLCFGTIDSWLIWKMTQGKVHATDPSNASRTMLFNIHTNSWDDSLLKIFNIPKNILPNIVPSSGVIGEYKKIPICSVLGDQQSALIGQGCYQKGSIKTTYGTGCFLLMNTADSIVDSQNNLLTTTAWDVKQKISYALEGSVFIGGALTQWLRDKLEIINSTDQIESLAASVPDSGGVTFIPAFTGLGAPHWNAECKAAITGLTLGTTKAHIARAALEGIALQVMDVINAMKKDTGLKIQQLKVDGGATKNNLLMQIQADLLGIPVVRSSMTESTAFGAAFMAGLAINAYSKIEDITELLSIDQVFAPTSSNNSCAQIISRWHDAIGKL